jgi:hemerythrin-like metal-binding protein
MDLTAHGGELGIILLDRDHKKIAELLLEINFNAVKDGDPSRQVRRLKELARLTRSHFLLEEGMMAATKYPGLAVHTLRHEWMMEQIRGLTAYWSRERDALTRGPMGLLWESHIAHVEGEDRAYGLWLNGCDDSSATE